MHLVGKTWKFCVLKVEVHESNQQTDGLISALVIYADNPGGDFYYTTQILTEASQKS